MSMLTLYFVTTLIPNLAAALQFALVLCLLAGGLLAFIGGLTLAESYSENGEFQAYKILKGAKVFLIWAAIFGFFSIPLPDTKQMLMIYSGNLVTNLKGAKELPE